jgi:hypothetical protein
MNERYRYGYGDEPADRDSASSRQGSMTEPREERPGEEPSASSVDEDEERRADQIREAAAGSAGPATGTASDDTGADDTGAGDEDEGSAGGGAAPASTASVFDVDDEPDAKAGDRAGEERLPIALGPPERDRHETAATTAPPDESEDLEPTSAQDAETAGTAKPEAASHPGGTPTTDSPAAVPTGADRLEPEPAGQGSTGTETEILMPGAGPAPVTAPADQRSAMLSSLDPDATRARFLDIQAGFVDEPRQAVEEAERFVDELVRTLVRALETERAKLKATIDDGSTEDLRQALRGYRAFVDRMLNLTM